MRPPLAHLGEPRLGRRRQRRQAARRPRLRHHRERVLALVRRAKRDQHRLAAAVTAAVAAAVAAAAAAAAAAKGELERRRPEEVAAADGARDSVERPVGDVVGRGAAAARAAARLHVDARLGDEEDGGELQHRPDALAAQLEQVRLERVGERRVVKLLGLAVLVGELGAARVGLRRRQLQRRVEAARERQHERERRVQQREAEAAAAAAAALLLEPHRLDRLVRRRAAVAEARAHLEALAAVGVAVPRVGGLRHLAHRQPQQRRLRVLRVEGERPRPHLEPALEPARAAEAELLSGRLLDVEDAAEIDEEAFVVVELQEREARAAAAAAVHRAARDRGERGDCRAMSNSGVPSLP